MEFLAFFLIHWGVLIVAYKYSIPRKIEDFGNDRGIKFLYDLGCCEFCIEHHIALLIVPFFGIWFTWEWVLIFYPFMSASLSNVIKSIKR